MTRTIGTVAISIPAVATTIYGMFGQGGGSLSESSDIKVGLAVMISSSIIYAAWQVSGKMTRLHDRLENVERTVKELPCTKPACSTEPNRNKR